MIVHSEPMAGGKNLVLLDGCTDEPGRNRVNSKPFARWDVGADRRWVVPTGIEPVSFRVCAGSDCC